MGAAALIGRLVMGGASDRIGRRGALAIALALQTGAFAGFAQSHALPTLYANSLVFGFSYGVASTLFPATVADVFGREQAGTLAGLLFALAGSMAALGPVDRRLHLRSRGRLPAGLVAQRGLQRARPAAARLLPHPGRPGDGRPSGRLTPPAALAYSDAA